MVEGFIQDNGIGLGPTHLPTNEHKGTAFGLLSMRERAELCGGSLVINSVDPHGTGLHIRNTTLPHAAQATALNYGVAWKQP